VNFFFTPYYYQYTHIETTLKLIIICFPSNFDILYLSKIFILVLKVEKNDEMQLNMTRSCDKKEKMLTYKMYLAYLSTR
jgi:hypothetical protein